MYLCLYILVEWSLTGVGNPKGDDGSGGDEFMAMAFLGPRGPLRTPLVSRPVPLSALKIHATSHYFFSFRL